MALWNLVLEPKNLLFGAAAACAYILFRIYDKALEWRFLKSGLQNKTVILTGASSGLGEALARVCHSAGAQVVLAARSIEKLKTLCRDLEESGQPGSPVPQYCYLDLSEPNNVAAQLVKLSKTGKIDILINNAGISHRGSCDQTSDDVYRQLLNVNFLGHVRLTQQILPHMDPGATVVFISSVQGQIAIPNRSAYAASKHALQAYADSLRAEIASSGRNVLVVNPGYIRTNLSLNALTGSGSRYGKMDETTEAGMDPEEVARKILGSLSSGASELNLAPLKVRTAVLLRRFWPDLFFYLMAKRAKSEEKDE